MRANKADCKLPEGIIFCNRFILVERNLIKCFLYIGRNRVKKAIVLTSRGPRIIPNPEIHSTRRTYRNKLVKLSIIADCPRRKAHSRDEHKYYGRTYSLSPPAQRQDYRIQQ